MKHIKYESVCAYRRNIFIGMNCQNQKFCNGGNIQIKTTKKKKGLLKLCRHLSAAFMPAGFAFMYVYQTNRLND